MHHGYSTPLVIAIMAFAIVAFLFLIDTAIMPVGSKNNTNTASVNKNTNQVACTDEAKLCPDGSAVGRSGPNCEFAECPTTTNTNSSSSTMKESTDVIDPSNTNVHIFTSYKLGIRFKYWSSSDEKNGALESDNKIYIYYYNGNTPSDPEEGQWVEMFEKNPNTSLADAITAKFLSDRSANDCFVKKITNTKPEDWEYAGISFPVVENETDPWWVNAEKCPQKYTASNWIGYFAMNKNAPDKFYFFSIGQYAIWGSDKQTPWQNTIELATDPTAGWKTYTNSTLGYTIKYPNDWGIGLETDKQTTISVAGNGTPFSAPSVSITRSEPDKPSSCLLKEETVTVLGESRLRQTQGCGYAGSAIATFIKKDDSYLSISWTEDVKSEYPTYELMLSTFTFTD